MLVLNSSWIWFATILAALGIWVVNGFRATWAGADKCRPTERTMGIRFLGIAEKGTRRT